MDHTGHDLDQTHWSGTTDHTVGHTYHIASDPVTTQSIFRIEYGTRTVLLSENARTRELLRVVYGAQ